MPVLRHIGVLVTGASERAPVRLRVHRDAALAWDGARVRWAGPEAQLPDEWRRAEPWDAHGRLVVPGLVDCHTHVVFGGWRTAELERRVRGATYAEIAREGGGIAATVEKTRAATDEQLFDRALAFLHEAASLGVTTVEAKSGYGLEPEDELRLLRVQRRLGAAGPVRIVSTLLAHVVPSGWRERRDEYVARFADELVPRAAAEGLADCCDVFVDDGAFTVDEGRLILDAAKRAGLLVKVHAEQLGRTGGASLAARLGAVSADHLEHVAREDVAELARSGTVAVTLPVAALYLSSPTAPARLLLDAGVPVAVATDFNPGSAPSNHLPLALLLACVAQRMTPEEALAGATSVAARALGLAGDAGALEPGMPADFAVIDAPSVADWLLRFRANACVLTVARGRVTWRAPGEEAA